MTSRRLADGALALVVLVVSIGGTTHLAPGNRWALALAVLAAVSLAMRRAWPLVTLAVVVVATSVYLVLGYPYGPILISVLVAGYTVARHLPLRRAAIAAAAAIAFLLVHAFVRLGVGPGLYGILAGSAWIIVAFVIGISLRLYRENVERDRAEWARRHADEERLRVAQEVHDVVGHGLSAIQMQADIALHVLPKQPGHAAVALAAISQTSREALDELRVALAQVTGGDGRAPLPGLARFDVAGRADLAEWCPGTDRDQRDPAYLAGSGRSGRLPGGTGVTDQCAPACRRGRRHGRGGLRCRGGHRAGTRHRSRRCGRAGTGDRRDARTGAGPGWFVCRRAGRAGRIPRHGNASGAMISVLIADDQDLVRLGLRTLVEHEDGLTLAGEAADGIEAVTAARRHQPDVVLMDIRMPGIDGIEATRRIVGDPDLAGTRVIVLTTFELDEYVFDALRSGASGFLIKDTKPAELVRAIRLVAAGDALLSPSVTRRVVREFAQRPTRRTTPHAQLSTLTDRELQIAGLVGEGLSNDEIADRLQVSPATARTHVSRAMVKLGARDRAQLVVFAYQSGLVEL